MIVKNIIHPKDAERLANAKKRLAANGGKATRTPGSDAERKAAANAVSRAKAANTPRKANALIANAKAAQRRATGKRRGI